MKGPFRRLLFCSCSCICKNSSSGSSCCCCSSSSSRQLFGHAVQALRFMDAAITTNYVTALQTSERAGPIHDPVKHPLRVLLMREPDKRRTQTQTHRQTHRHTKAARNIQSWALLCLIDCVFLFLFFFFFFFLTIFCFCICF